MYIHQGNYLFRCCCARHCTDSHILKPISKDSWRSFCHFGYFMKKIVFLCCCALHCTDSHMLKPISKDDVGIQCEFMMCSAQRKTKIGYYVPTIQHNRLNYFLKKHIHFSSLAFSRDYFETIIMLNTLVQVTVLDLQLCYELCLTPPAGNM